MQSPSAASPDSSGGHGPRRGPAVALLLLFTVGFAIAGVGLVSWIRAQQHIAKESQLKGRLAQLRLALENYHLAHGNFPPYYAQGTAPATAQSWRVALLPSMDLDDIHAQYAASEAWDSPANQRLASSLGEAPAFFRSPFSRSDSSHFSDFVIVPLQRVPQVANAGTHVTIIESGNGKIAIAEQPDSTTHWMDPNGN
jgi:hypothetical protein